MYELPTFVMNMHSIYFTRLKVHTIKYKTNHSRSFVRFRTIFPPWRFSW